MRKRNRAAMSEHAGSTAEVGSLESLTTIYRHFVRDAVKYVYHVPERPSEFEETSRTATSVRSNVFPFPKIPQRASRESNR